MTQASRPPRRTPPPRRRTRPPRRSRRGDLRRGWDLHRVLLTVVLVAVLLTPVVALIHPLVVGWSPHGDDATAVLRSGDVVDGHPPFTGMRSTSGDGGHPELASHHLGPIQLYLLAVPLALTGGSPLGVVLGGVVVAAVCCVLTLVWARRLGGELGMLVVGVGLLVAQWGVGLEALYRPLNPYPAQLPVYLLLVLTWALLLGDRRALAPFVLASAVVLQAHLAFVPLGLTLTLLGLGALLAQRRRDGGRRPGGRRARRRDRLRVLGVLALAVLVWLPTMLEPLRPGPGNLAQVWRWATSGTSDAIGLVAALEHLSLLAPVPGGYRRMSDDLLLSGTPLASVLGGVVLVVLAVVSTGWRVPHGRRSTVWPARVALVANLAMLLTASRLPDFPAAPYWIMPWLPVAAFTWAALAWRACAWVRDLGPVLPARGLVAGAVGVGLLALGVAGTTGRPDRERDAAMTQAGQLVAGEIGPGEGRPVRVEGFGFTPLLAATPAIAYALDRDGWQSHHLVEWPFAEDAAHRWTSTAPPDSERVLVIDSAEPELASSVPVEAQRIGSVDMPDRDSRLYLYRVPGG